MTQSQTKHPLLKGLNITNYEVQSLDDEIRVDKLCVDLLRHLNQDLIQRAGFAPEQAGLHSHGADYFLREFIVAECRDNLFKIAPLRVRQFAGHWYIIRTPEPNLTELKMILSGTTEFYRFLNRQELIAKKVSDEISSHCEALDFYQQRIDDFWTIEDDGYDHWRQACPLDSGTT